MNTHEIHAGNMVYFGNYPKGADGAVSPVEWQVLEVRDGRAQLLSRYGLDAKPFSTDGLKWETCGLRGWLNGAFLNTCFSPEEQAYICETKVDNSAAQGFDMWRARKENDTSDKVFLPSYAEARRYFDIRYWMEKSAGENVSARTAPTEYAKTRGVKTDGKNLTAAGEPTGVWWLRSPGYMPFEAAAVQTDGALLYARVDSGFVMVRPALWVSTEAL